MSSVEFIPATPKIIEEFYGEKPKNTIKAFVGRDEENIYGVIGYYLLPRKQGAVLFSEVRNDPPKREIVRGIRKTIEMAKRLRIPVYAYPDPNIEHSPKLLKRLGFEEIKNGLYRMT
jgi:hypothetical protein